MPVSPSGFNTASSAIGKRSAIATEMHAAARLFSMACSRLWQASEIHRVR